MFWLVEAGDDGGITSYWGEETRKAGASMIGLLSKRMRNQGLGLPQRRVDYVPPPGAFGLAEKRSIKVFDK